MNELLSDASSGIRRFEVPAGVAVYEEQTPAKAIYFIESGQMRLFLVGPDNSARLLEILGPDDWFGSPALAGAEVYGSRALVAAPAVISEIPADRFLELLPQFPTLARDFVRQLALKLQWAQLEAANLVFDDTKDRLIKALLHLSHTAAASPLESGEGIELRITHQQLAQAIGAARETVSLTLTELRQSKLLRTGRNRLLFNPQALEQFYRREAKPPQETQA